MTENQKKYRQYATDAFRLYAMIGESSADEYKRSIEEKVRLKFSHESAESVGRRVISEINVMKREILDVGSVDDVMKELRAKGRDDIIGALKCVYFAEPARIMKKGEIKDRVLRYATDYHADARTVYRWLGIARRKFFEARGMNTIPD